jgi:polyisoprenoid-binding protein YceI
MRKEAAVKILVASLAVVLGSLPARAADKYELDSVHCFAAFKIKHMNIGTTWGRINNPAGTILLDDADPSKSSVSVELRAENVDTANEKRDQHLKGPDFFNAKQFPTITFKSKSVKKSGDAAFAVTGEFTLLGVTKEITVTLARTGPAKDPFGGTRVGFDGTFTIRRSEYGMKQMLEAIGDEVEIHLAFEGVKK